MVCVKPHVDVKLSNSFDANCGPLSETSVSGTPYLA